MVGDPAGLVRAHAIEHVSQIGEWFDVQGMAALHQARDDRLDSATMGADVYLVSGLGDGRGSVRCRA